MGSSIFFLVIGGAAVVLASLTILARGKSAGVRHPYSRTAFALAPVQLALGLVAVVFGLKSVLGW